ncbi:3-oxoacyl-[acyl-carrier-protein] reductase FabG [Coleophoma cylindrospora]|uniref:3-oxoacyl-[acyl-carrier-protein] reductase FabG n=1 Tax=Coleophoma cylindrospora TaxID=1849047 RepID=A0A3D8S1W9_9HELO|nr:3-oxoacyl-[acyl-carrier-protein] reductase FabG [Coleophoma cylindrospora]
MGLLQGVALITGAGCGIGQDCAKSFAVEGCTGVVFADIDLGRAEAAAREGSQLLQGPQCQVLALQVDVADRASVNAMVAGTVEQFGRIDYCVHSAGIGAQQPYSVLDMPQAEFDRFHAVNVGGTLNVIQAISQQMLTQKLRAEPARNGAKTSRGAIVTLASCHSIAAARDLSQYITSKHAVLGLTRSAALDLARHSIRVNAVCPGWVDTPMVAEAVNANPDIGRYINGLVPFGRMATVEEISDVAVFLASPRASFVTGASWIVDGGLTVGFPSREE